MAIDERLLLTDPIQERNAEFQTAPGKRVWVNKKWSPPSPTGSAVGAGGEAAGSNTAYDQPAPPAPTRIPQDDASYGAYAGGGGGGFKAERAAPAPAPAAQDTGYNWKAQYGQEGLAPPQFGAESVATGVAADICGPIAAVAFARATGRNPSIAEAVQMAKENGRWSADTGMYGPSAEQSLLNDMGVSSRLEDAPSKQRVIQDILNGNPVILSSPGHYHYFVATAYDPATDTFDTGNTGNIFKNPAANRTWRTWEDIGPQAALYIDEPSSPAPSVAVGNEGAGHGADPVQPPLPSGKVGMMASANEGSAGPYPSDQRPVGAPPTRPQSPQGGGYPGQQAANAWEAPASAGASSGRQATPQQAGGYTYSPQPSYAGPIPQGGVTAGASAAAPSATPQSSGRQAGPMTQAPAWPASPPSTARPMPTSSPGYQGDVPDMRQPTQGQQLQQATAWVPTPTVPAGGPPVNPTDQRTWMPGVTDQPGWTSNMPWAPDAHWQPPLSQAPNGGTTLPGGTLGVRPENVTRVLAGNGAS